MNKIVFSIILLIQTVLSYSQEYLIKGKVIEGQSLFPVSGLTIGFDSIYNATTRNDGSFELSVNEKYLSDTLQISWIGYYKIKITNFPKDSIIDLGTIPIFEYLVGTPIVSFYGIGSYFRRKRFWKKNSKIERKYYDRMNIIIGYYRLCLKEQCYSIDVDKHLIDLSKPIKK